MNMNYIIIYLEIEHLLNFLTQEEKGDFLDLLISYGKNQKLPEIENKKLLNVFNFMKGRLDTQFEKAKLKAETAKKNGATGGRPKKEAKRKQTKSKTEANVNVNVNEECKLKLELKSQLQLPNFIDKNLFDSFVQMRNKIKKPLTDYAKELLLKDLTKFENIKTGNANIALENSIKNSWQGVFEPKPKQQQTFLTKQQIEEQRDLQIYSNLTKKYGGDNA